MSALAHPCSRRGVATLEFALAAPLLLLMLAAVSDLGFALLDKMKLASGVANAARYAMLTQGAATATTLSAIIGDASSLSGVQTTVSATGCFCPSGSPAALAAATCGNTCSNGAMAGTYQTITATYSYSPVMPGYSLLAGNALSEAATVQVK